MKSWTLQSFSDFKNNASLMAFKDGNPWFYSSDSCKIFSNAEEIHLPHQVQDVICIEFLVFERIWVVGTVTDIYTYDGQWEKVGEIDDGIQAFVWSPDQSVLVIVSGNNKLLLLSADFQVINESFLDNDVPVEAMVALGWGKKETQFHGSAGKSAALVKSVAKLSENDDGKVRVSWRGDAEHFVVSFLNVDKRSLKVYNRMGGLHSESEELDNLEHALSWRPSGNWITSSQKLPNRHEIVFIEKNGLKHREFVLRNRNCVVNEVIWNCDSSGLAVQIYNAEEETNELQFWSINNYHWYLKHSIHFEKSDLLYKFYWDPVKPLVVHYLTSGGFYGRLQFITDIYVSGSLSGKNPGTVAVVDGNMLKMTPFRFQNVPPPMSSFTLELSNPVSHVSFLPSENGDNICVQTNDGKLSFFESQIKCRTSIQIPSNLGSVQLPDLDLFHYRQVTWVQKDIIVAISYNRKERFDEVAILHIQEKNSIIFISKKEYLRIADSQLSRIQIGLMGEIFVQSMTGTVIEMLISSAADPSYIVRDTFPEFCPWFSSLRIENQGVLYVGMSDSNTLYLNQKILSAECTSYFIHNHHLLFTTFSHTLCLMPLNSSYEDFNLDNMEESPNNDQLRRIEIGSQIVLAIPGDTRVVFQMPRGNLETVHPRGLLLEHVKSLLNNKEYLEAFLICRKNRLDLNLLIDYDRQSFVKNISTALKQIENQDYINLLIASMNDKNVTKTIYKNSFPKGEIEEQKGKVNMLCDLIVSTLEELDKEKYLNAILTGLSKKSPPDLENATKRILSIKETRGTECADDAIKYLIFLADPNKLFDYALGVYDLELVVMVAQNSQKDPRDYLQFLNSLQQMEQNFQRFTIDNHLGRYEKALKNLVLSGEIDQSFEYIKNHGLYKISLEIFRNDPINYPKALLQYAYFLESNEEYEEAAALYLFAQNEARSLECFKQSLSWQEAFLIAHKLNFSSEELNQLGSEMMVSLKESNRYQEAARIAIDYQLNIELGIEILSLGGFWNEAMRIGTKHHIPEVLHRIVEPKMLQSLQYLLDDIREISSSFRRDREKLLQVRKRNARKEELANNPNLENIDLQSDTSSMATTFISGTSFSNMSSRTARTAKQKRKMERKKAAGKVEAFQEEYLTECLRKCVEKGNELQEDVSRRLKFMIIHGYFAQAKTLQTEFGDAIDMMEESIPDIFTKNNQITMEEVKEKWFNDPQSLTKLPEHISPPIIQNYSWKVDFISL